MSVCSKYKSGSSLVADCCWDSAGHHTQVRWSCGFLCYHKALASYHLPKPCLLLSLRQDPPDVLWESGWAGALGARVGQVPWLSLLPCLGKYTSAFMHLVPALQVAQNTVLVCSVTRQNRKTSQSHTVCPFHFLLPLHSEFSCAHCFWALQRIHKTFLSWCQE